MIRIRKAVDDDVASILRLVAQLDATGQPELNVEEGIRVLRKIHSCPNHVVYVAEDPADTIVGTFALLVMDNLAHRGAPAAIVENVCVDERTRGRGVGRAMMKYAMELATRHGCYKLALSSNTARTKAHEFYRALGFQQHGLSFRVNLPGSRGTP